MAGGGGSEACAMWAIDALRESYDVTFATVGEFDLTHLNRTYGTTVQPGEIAVIKAPGLPGLKSGTQLAYLLRTRFATFCRKRAHRFDACISTYNPMDFGRPAIHLLGDFSWSDDLRRQIYPNNPAGRPGRSEGIRLLTINAWNPDHPLPKLLNRSDPAHLSIDGAGHRDKRLAALRCHTSQTDYFKEAAQAGLEGFIDATEREQYRLWEA